jgi:hypothetical protein
MKSEQYESSVEVGQSRAPELLPPPDELARIHEELQNGSDLGHACAEIRRLGVDHGATIGTPQVMTALFQAMTHQGELRSDAAHPVHLRIWPCLQARGDVVSILY